MATTTNYGWTTPDDTALVKDGASAIRTLGTSVDTTTKNLNPETTLADLAYRSSTANVKTRLGIGTTGQVLTVAAGVPTWATPPAAGSMTSLASGSIAASATGIDITSISGIYYELLLYITNASGTNSAAINLRTNNNSSADYNRVTITSAAGVVVNETALTVFKLTEPISTTENLNAVIRFPNYANTTGYKLIQAQMNYNNLDGMSSFGFTKTTAAIDRITVLVQAGTFDSGTYELFGVK